MPFVYKKFKASDVSLVHFNAHKTWSFDSASATSTGSNEDSSTLHPPGFSWGTASWTSMSMDQYSTSSAQHWKNGSHLKYHQIDHLFYDGYPRGTNALNLFGDIYYNNQKRELNETVWVLSIPQQTYGQQIRPGTFKLEASCYFQNPLSGGFHTEYSSDPRTYSSINSRERDSANRTFIAIDDGKGNLMHSASGVTPQPNVTDIDARVFHIGPTKGFKKTDLHTDETGKRRVNPPTNELGPRYSISASSCTQNYSHTSSISQIPQYFPTYNKKWLYDDTYFGNLLHYKNVTFGPSDPSGIFNSHPFINFHANSDGMFRTSSYSKIAGGAPVSDYLHTIGEYHTSNTRGSTIISPHNEKWNFNNSEDFTIAFWMMKACEPVCSLQPSGSGEGNHSDNGVNHPTAIKTLRRNFTPNKQWIIGKSTTKTIVPSSQAGRSEHYGLNIKGSAQEIDVDAEPQFPFEIYYDDKYVSRIAPISPGEGESYGGNARGGGSTYSSNLACSSSRLVFRRSDGQSITEVTNVPYLDNYTWTNGCAVSNSVALINHPLDMVEPGKWNHVVCMYSHSIMKMYINGGVCGSSGSDIGTIKGASSITPYDKTNQTTNNANLYIGSKGGKEGFLSGSLSKIMIYDYALSQTEINYLITSSNYPYIGNIFYNTGIATITDQHFANVTKHSQSLVGGPGDYELIPVPEVGEISYQGTMPIVEHEYQCTVDENDFNFSNNVSVRIAKNNQKAEIANTYTGSAFKPYVTTIGLYNEQNDLLVVGKLGQPVRMSDETDTTFVLRWDT